MHSYAERGNDGIPSPTGGGLGRGLLLTRRTFYRFHAPRGNVAEDAPRLFTNYHQIYVPIVNWLWTTVGNRLFSV